MSAEQAATTPLRAPLGQLELALIDQFVRARGYDPLKLDELPEHERETLLKEASLHASAKLAEIESRSHFLDEIHDGIPGVHKAGLD
jgi:hypothetical protein